MDAEEMIGGFRVVREGDQLRVAATRRLVWAGLGIDLIPLVATLAIVCAGSLLANTAGGGNLGQYVVAFAVLAGGGCSVGPCNSSRRPPP